MQYEKQSANKNAYFKGDYLMNNRAFTVCFDLFIPSLASFTLTRIPKMKNLITVVCATAIIALAGCSSSSTPPPREDVPPGPPPPSATILVLQASPDAPLLNVSFDGDLKPPAGSPLLDMDYKSGTVAFTLDTGPTANPAGTYEFQVDAELPDETTATVIGPVDMTFVENMEYIIVTVGNYAEIAQVVFEQTIARTGASARLRIIHAAPLQGPVDVYVTAPDADLTLEAPLGPIDFGEALDPLEFAPGDYQLRITTAGDSADVLLDTGTTTLSDIDDVVVSVVENTTAGGVSPLSLVVLDGNDDAFEVLDAASTGDVRVVHSSVEAGTIDVLADDVELFTDLTYTDFTDFAAMAPATYDVAVTPADMPATELIQTDLAVAAGESYTYIALTNEVTVPAIDPAVDPFIALVTNDDRRSVATDAKLRFIHGAPTANTDEDGNQAGVDVYLTAVGADITLETPELEAFAFATNTGFGGMVPGTYDLTVTATGDATVIIVPAVTITIDAAGIYTVIMRDLVLGDGADFIMMDDFATPIVVP